MSAVIGVPDRTHISKENACKRSLSKYAFGRGRRSQLTSLVPFSLFFFLFTLAAGVVGAGTLRHPTSQSHFTRFHTIHKRFRRRVLARARQHFHHHHITKSRARLTTCLALATHTLHHRPRVSLSEPALPATRHRDTNGCARVNGSEHPPFLLEVGSSCGSDALLHSRRGR